MVEFYDVHNPAGERVWIAAREDTDERRLYVWLADTGRWHWNEALQADFYANDPELEYLPLNVAQAAQNSAELPRINRVTGGWIADKLNAAASLSSNQLGLPAIVSARPTTQAQLADALRKTPHDWVRVSGYPPERVKAARTLASEIRTGKKSSLRTLGPLEARTRLDDGEIVVEARRAIAADKRQTA